MLYWLLAILSVPAYLAHQNLKPFLPSPLGDGDTIEHGMYQLVLYFLLRLYPVEPLSRPPRRQSLKWYTFRYWGRMIYEHSLCICYLVMGTDWLYYQSLVLLSAYSGEALVRFGLLGEQLNEYGYDREPRLFVTHILATFMLLGTLEPFKRGVST